jgi:hypothetical protein
MTGYQSKKGMAQDKLVQAKEILLQHPQKDIDWQREQQIKAHTKLNDDDDDAQPEQGRQWIWLSDADIADVVDTTCQYTGGYEEYLIKKAERKIRSINNGK